MDTISYQDCLSRIYKLGRFGIKLELDTISDILTRLENPHTRFRSVHVAGTNGKGSTATYIGAVLRQAGFKTGVYTSPHLVRFNERITIDGMEISDNEVVEAFKAVEAADVGKRKATYFEIVTAMGFYHFAQAGVDWAVIETGMGGRCDATNIITPEVSVITNLSIEHTEYLGRTIKSLATEKGGIIKKGVPVVSAVSQPSGRQVLEAIADEKGSRLYFYKRDFSIRKNPVDDTYAYNGINHRFSRLTKALPGDHQKENLSLALAACELISQSPDISARWEFTESLAGKGISGARWPGRLELVQEHPAIILDGAHNLDATKVLKKYLSDFLKGRHLTLVVGILDDKPYEKMLANLIPLATRIIVTRPAIDRGLDTSILKQTAETLTRQPITVVEDVRSAVRHAMDIADKTDVICVAGSLYVVGEAKELFDNRLDQTANLK